MVNVINKLEMINSHQEAEIIALRSVFFKIKFRSKTESDTLLKKKKFYVLTMLLY